MLIPKTTYTTPSARTVQQRSEIIDREGLDEIQCDLDYAPQRELPPKSGRRIAIAVLQATIVGTIAAWIVGEYVVPFTFAIVPLPLIGATVLLVAMALAIDTSRALEENLIRLLKNIWIAVWGSAAIVATAFLMQSVFSALWLLIVAMPVAVHFAYRFTTFGVHWITGHPLGDGPVMLQCRDLWQHRYERIPDSVPDALSESPRTRERWQYALRAIRSHDYGFLWCFGAVAAALTVTWCSRDSFPASVIGLHAAISTVFGLFIAAVVRCGGKLPLQLTTHMLFRWFTYDWDAQATPWMFQSPCGDMHLRRRWFWAVLATMAVAINHLAGGYAVVSVPASQAFAILWPEWTQPVLMTLITGGCCIVVPLIAFALTVCIVAGPALAAFDRLYSQ